MPMRVRLRFGDNEIEVEGTNSFVTKQLRDFLERVGPSSASGQDLTTTIAKKVESKKSQTKAQTPAELIRLKGPKGGTETLLVLAKYLEDQGASDFRAQEINAAASLGKIKKIHPTYFAMAVKQGLLRQASRGRYGLTLSGEDAVNAMTAAKKPQP